MTINEKVSFCKFRLICKIKNCNKIETPEYEEDKFPTCFVRWFE